MKTKRLDIFRLTLLLVIFLTSALTVLAKNYDYFMLDLQITKFIQNLNTIWIDGLLKFLSYLGNSVPSVISILITAAFLVILKRYWEGVMVIVSSFGAIFISETVKVLISRPRPDASLISQLEIFTRADSFPSGHVLYAVGLYGFLFFLVFTKMKERHFLRPLLLVVLLVPLLLMGVSRIYLGAHWTSDVMGAYLIGYIWLFIITHLYMARK